MDQVKESKPYKNISRRMFIINLTELNLKDSSLLFSLGPDWNSNNMFICSYILKILQK